MPKKIDAGIISVNEINLFAGFDWATFEAFANGSDTIAVADLEALTAEEAPMIVIGPKEPKPKEIQIPSFKEKIAVQTVAAVQPSAVILNRIGRKDISVSPYDLITSVELFQMKMFDKPWNLAGNEDLKPSKRVGDAKDSRLYFPVEAALHSDGLNKSRLVQFLKSRGLTPIWGPSIEGWVAREYRRREREATPFDLPIVKDDRPLYDRLEMGLLLTCIQSKGNFEEGGEYIVVETDQLQEEEDEDENKVEKAAVGLKKNDGRSGQPIYWGELDGVMEEFFEVKADITKAFDPENVFPKRFPELYQAARKRIEKANRPIYDYHKHDIPQAVYHRHLAFTHQPRQGKTSAIIEYTENAGSKSALFVTVKNGVDVFVEELKRLGIKDFKVLKKLSDLNHPAKYKLAAFSWLKSTGRQKSKDQDERLSSKSFCPHCKEALVRPMMIFVTDDKNKKVLDSRGRPILKFDRILNSDNTYKLKWTDHVGYMCRNKLCVSPEGKRYNYVDTRLARHAQCVIHSLDKFHRARQCSGCGYVHKAWIPPRYKHVGKRFSMLGVDEIHNIKSPGSDQSRAIMGMMHAKRRVGMTGTLMPNNPADAFYPLSWTFGNNNHEFKFAPQSLGVQQFNEEYTEKVIVEKGNSSYAKAVPFIKKPIQFWQWKASKTLFREYGDPFVKESMAKVGLSVPKFRTIPVELVPDIKQAILLVSSIEDFNKGFKEYSAELKEKTQNSNKQYLVNSAQVLASMMLMKYAATIPGLVNDRAIEKGQSSVYQGSYGGCKVEHVKNLVKEKTQGKGKVVIFSDMKAMQELLAKELTLYNPIKFETKWGNEKRAEMFQLFQKDDNYRIFICGPRAVKESVDLSRADTVISTDLLWSPGIQLQAWSRTLTPRKTEREVECHVLLTKYSIDSHVFQTFYSKTAAAEQALYGRAITKAEKGFDVQYFVDQIISEKAAIMQWLVDSGEDEMVYMPVLKTLQQLQSYEDAAA